MFEENQKDETPAESHTLEKNKKKTKQLATKSCQLPMKRFVSPNNNLEGEDDDPSCCDIERDMLLNFFHCHLFDKMCLRACWAWNCPWG